MSDLTLEGVEFKRVPSWDYYFVSSSGIVWSAPRAIPCYGGFRHKRGNFLANTNHGGRPQVTLRGDGRIETELVSRIVLLTWVGPPPEGKPFACHEDDNPSNNTLNNLYWGSPKENSEDCKANGGFDNQASGECHPNAKFAKEEIKKIYSDILLGHHFNEILEKYAPKVSYILLYNLKCKRAWRKVTDEVDKEIETPE